MSTNIHKSSIKSFFALVKTGLWADANHNHGVNLNEKVDWDEVYQLAGEQSVVGLVLAGLERTNVKPPQELLLQWIGEVQIIEQTNITMNKFVAKLIENLRKEDVYAILVKGQGIAQCYGKPLWRASGDVDLLLSDSNHRKAISYLIPLSSSYKNGGNYSKEYAVTIDDWMIELHGSLRTGLSGRVDKEVDAVQRDVFFNGSIRSWNNGNTQIFLPSPDNDVFFVFTHFIKHFYKEGGVSIRQLCDWCRLLWTYKDSLDYGLLESRIRKAGLMSEWNAFASLAVEYLGMPAEAMPLYSSDKKWKKKAKKIAAFILKGGEWRRFKDTLAVGKIFPLSTFRFLPGILLSVNWLKIKERLFTRI